MVMVSLIDRPVSSFAMLARPNGPEMPTPKNVKSLLCYTSSSCGRGGAAALSAILWEPLPRLLVGVRGVERGPILVTETVEDLSLGTGKTVLVAEDEVLVRLDISDYLRAHGYNVIEANSAAEAIQVFKSDLEVAVVFTDVRMPGTTDGIDLAR